MYIGEIAKRSGASPKAIRLYESLGLLVDIKRQGRYRIYDERDVKFVRLIKDAQTLGVSLSDLRSLVVERNELNWHAAIELLAEKLNRIDHDMKALARQKEKVEQYRSEIEKCLNPT
ncbi:MerR family transcriptional regulator [Vibrio scophthalmi]|uniref:MerR family transcriptional regulator n=1 Tax=Vibrio scophthalmi TaxID=45658 RepID=UPI003AAAD4CE